MTINESDRFELHVGLEKLLGDKLTNTLMDHLPPSGWSDVARRADLDHLERMIEMRFQGIDNRFQGIDSRFQGIDSRFQEIDRRLDRIDGTLKLIIGTGIAFGLALLAIQVQIMVSIANL